jgi:hypothetical protein
VTFRCRFPLTTSPVGAVAAAVATFGEGRAESASAHEKLTEAPGSSRPAPGARPFVTVILNRAVPPTATVG